MQLKKSFSIFLAILLLMSNFGLAINVHFCGDKIASITSTISTSDALEVKCCCINETSEKTDCCKDKLVDLKKEIKEVTLKSFSFEFHSPYIIVPSSEIIFAATETVISTPKIADYFYVSNSPPLFKLYNQFIFYA